MHTTPSHRMRGLRACALLFALALLSACGGGGSGSAPSVIVSLPPSAASQADSNVAIITVESGPRNNVNIPYVSVTLCAPGSTSNCKTIDHVLLDTGSTGLRIFASNLASAPALTLPPHTVGSSSTISECAQFLNAMAWGPVKVADVVIGSKTALSVPVQVMETSAAPTADCGSAPLMAPPSFSASSSFSPLSANGILGVSQFINDGQTYFNCANPVTGACSFRPASTQQVQNPVSRFTTDNNGVVIQLPTISAAGATVVHGYLIFGVGTQGNNLLGSANVLPLNRLGYFTTTYKGSAYTSSFMDSGSNGLFFDDTAISSTCRTAASGFYCPGSALALTADINLGGSSAQVNFSVGNADTLFQGNSFAFNNLGGTMGAGMFDWGLPFFFGRSVYTVVEGKTVGGRTGPFYAFTN